MRTRAYEARHRAHRCAVFQLPLLALADAGQITTTEEEQRILPSFAGHTPDADSFESWSNADVHEAAELSDGK
jgi:hypothetical protein